MSGFLTMFYSENLTCYYLFLLPYNSWEIVLLSALYIILNKNYFSKCFSIIGFQISEKIIFLIEIIFSSECIHFIHPELLKLRHSFKYVKVVAVMLFRPHCFLISIIFSFLICSAVMCPIPNWIFKLIIYWNIVQLNLL